VTVYNVYEPPEGADADAMERAEKVVFVKEGFNWVALIVPAFWLLFQRMWLELVVLLVLVIGPQWMFGPEEAGQRVAGLVTLGLTVLFAFEANDLRGWALQRRGYRFAGVATGRGRDEAERSFFTAWLPQQDRRVRAPAQRPKTKTGVSRPPASSPSRASDADEVIGSFPRA
jgi:hypothetical protein